MKPNLSLSKRAQWAVIPDHAAWFAAITAMSLELMTSTAVPEKVTPKI